jgi:hypothetical protein
MQTFHVENISDKPASIDNWDFVGRPDLTWIYSVVIGVVVFMYGFAGFWLCERKRKLWRISLHCTSPPKWDVLIKSIDSGDFDCSHSVIAGQHCHL